jgi:hypothetical protein
MSNRRALGHPRWREGFRETFLVVFTRKGDASALRRLSLLLSELYVCAAPRWWPYPKGSELDAVLRAVVADLRHLRHVLAWAGGGNAYSMEQSALAHFAGDLGGDLEEVAASIESAMADPKGTLKRQQGISDAAVFIRREVAR